ncbi:hypothetical protein AB4059_06345 [Lysobacter sp. 2RAF19]
MDLSYPLRRGLLASALLAALATPAYAQTADQRMSALEAKIKQLEEAQAQTTQALQDARAEIEALKANPPVQAQSAEQPQVAEQAQEAPAEEVASSGESAASNPNAFNPAMSVILNGRYAYNSLNPDDYVRAGFPLAGEAGPGPQGLSLGESEFAFSSNIDDKFYGQATLSVHNEDGEDHLGVEEAYIDTIAMPGGLSLRAGRFFSNIGYLNSHHAHTDAFSDRPLAYQAFLGNQYGDDGVQVRWVAPTDVFFEIGGEVMRGDSFPSGGAGHAGAGVKTLFAHAGGDVGTNNEWLAGVSMLRSQTDGAEDGFRGDEKLYIADFTWKWAPGGNTKDGGVTVRSEYFHEDRDGLYLDPADSALDQPWSGQRAGAYVEGIWRINRTWETGYRYDRLWSDDSGPFASDFDPFRHSVMLAWHNSEFTLIRLQLGQDRPNAQDTDNIISLQYQAAFGAHGAHKF